MLLNNINRQICSYLYNINIKKETITNEGRERLIKENDEDRITLTRDEYDAIAKFVGFEDKYSENLR